MNERLNDILSRKVTKRNDIIQHSRYALSNAQNKTLSYMLSKITPTDPPEKMYKVYYRDIIKLLNWSDHGMGEVKKIVKQIADASVFVDIKNGKETLVRWLDLVNVDKTTDDSRGVGYIEYTFHKTVQPYIFNLQKQKAEQNFYFSSITLRDSALMKNKYSPRIYEILKSYQFNNQKWRFEIGTGGPYDLCRMIADVDKNGRSCIPASWSKYAEFDRTVLKKVKEDINKYSDIRIDYKPLRMDFAGNRYKKYVAVEFVMCGKTEDEIRTRDGYIEEEYRSFLEEEANGQMTLTALLENFEVKNDKKEVKESDFRKRFPVFCGEFEECGFTEKQLKRLQQLACEKKCVNVAFENTDLWVTDYVSYYYDEIMASEAETKTSVYARLKDCVEKDYKGRGYVGGPWEQNETYSGREEIATEEYVNDISEVVEVIDGNVVVEENVSSGVDPILGGVVFLSQDDKNKECKERTYKARGFMVQIIPQDEYLKIRNKIISD